MYFYNRSCVARGEEFWEDHPRTGRRSARPDFDVACELAPKQTGLRTQQAPTVASRRQADDVASRRQADEVASRHQADEVASRLPLSG